MQVIAFYTMVAWGLIITFDPRISWSWHNPSTPALGFFLFFYDLFKFGLTDLFQGEKAFVGFHFVG